MPLSPDEAQRYARHIVLKGMGGGGQQRLGAARVLVVGAGGLGSPVVAYLAAAGIGTLGILDDDRVALSDLQRQIVHRTADQGRPKVESAARFASGLNPHLRAVPIPARLTEANAAALVAGYDLVVDGSDNFAARSTAAAACLAAQKPLVSGAVAMFDGQVTVFAPYLRDAQGEPYPTFRCLYPDDPDPDDLPNCEQVGVLATLPGVIGTMMANEAIKLLTGIGTPLYGRLLVYSARSGETRLLRYRRRLPAR